MNTTCQYCGAINGPTCVFCDKLIAKLAYFFISPHTPNTLALIARAKQRAAEAEIAHRLANEQMVENLKDELGVRKPIPDGSESERTKLSQGFFPSADFPGWERKAAADHEPAYRPIGSPEGTPLHLHREVVAIHKRDMATGGDQ